MINKLFYTKFPFVSKYFDTLIENDTERFPQSIVLEGLDIIGQYAFSMELARILNCKETGGEDCNCINCQWIKDIKHPSVNIVSPINYKDDTSKTVISINQAKKITSSLRETSDYHRFFIFCNAKIKQRSGKEQNLIKEYEPCGFNFPEEGWMPLPLNTKVFKSEASNSLLKSIEEPPQKTTFIFLTQNKEDLISTIVSRSNVFKLGKTDGLNRAFCNQNVQPLFNKYFQEIIRQTQYDTKIQSAVELAAEAENIIKTDEIDIFDFLNDFQEYILSIIKENLANRQFCTGLETHIRLIQKVKNRLNTSMNSKIVLESLFLETAEL